VISITYNLTCLLQRKQVAISWEQKQISRSHCEFQSW